MTVVEPRNIGRLLRDPKRGVPVPWFVAWIDGQPDFRVIAPGRIEDALRFGLCWVCGQRRGRYSAFVVGPMCAINRTSAEPPSHLDCATYSAMACPFLVNPQRRRRESQMPEGTADPAGQMIRRNPGVALVWVTKKFHLWHDDSGGLLFDVGQPDSVRWYAHGRDATRDEVWESIESGLPILAGMAEEEGQGAVAELERRTEAAKQLLPAGGSS